MLAVVTRVVEDEEEVVVLVMICVNVPCQCAAIIIKLIKLSNWIFSILSGKERQPDKLGRS